MTEAFFEPLLSADQAANLLGGIHPKTLMRKARNGEVPGYQISRSWFFRASELDNWLRSLVPSTQANNTRVN
jgi:excisionase family DNA binding protein